MSDLSFHGLEIPALRKMVRDEIQSLIDVPNGIVRYANPNLVFNGTDIRSTILWSDNSQDTSGNSNTVTVESFLDSQKGYVLKVTPTSSSYKWCPIVNNFYRYHGGFRFSVGSKYTISFDIKCSKPSADLVIRFADGNSSNPILGYPDSTNVQPRVTCTTEWTHHSFVGTCLNDGSSAPVIMFFLSDYSTSYYITNLKLEEGDVDTGINPAIPDSIMPEEVVIIGNLGEVIHRSGIMIAKADKLNPGALTANTGKLISWNFNASFIDTGYAIVVSAVRDSAVNYADIQVSPYKQINRAVIYIKSSTAASDGSLNIEGLAVGRWK